MTAGSLPTASGVPHQHTDQQHAVPFQARSEHQPSCVKEDAKKQELIAQAIQLILAARERVLTLSEQRVINSLSLSTHPHSPNKTQFLVPLIPHLTSPPVLTSLDLSPLISHNPTLAHPLLVSLIASTPTTPSLQFPSDLQHPRIASYLDVLRFLPPTLATFDLLGRLLRDTTRIPSSGSTIADLIRIHVLGRFIHESINWLDRAERDERDGLISDDRFAKGVQNVRALPTLYYVCLRNSQLALSHSSAASTPPSSNSPSSTQPQTPSPPKWPTSPSETLASKKPTLSTVPSSLASTNRLSTTHRAPPPPPSYADRSPLCAFVL